MLVGVIPFGLVAGATPASHKLGVGAAVAFSTIVFAGASQLAAMEVLIKGGLAAVAIAAACTINLRMLLYSASLAPFLAEQPLRRRLLVAYLLTDQAYAVSITRWAAAEPDADPHDLRLDTVPARLREVGDPSAGLDGSVGRLDALLDLADRDEHEGLGDAPWPPHFKKQRGEPRRVQPSRARRG